MLNTESASSLGRWKSRHGANIIIADRDEVPGYIRRCKLKKEILRTQAEIMEKLSIVAPVKHRKMVHNGFDPIVMTLSDAVFDKMVGLMHDGMSLADAYCEILRPAARSEKQLESARRTGIMRIRGGRNNNFLCL